MGEKDVKNMLQKFCFVILSEIKTSAKITCTGFTVFQHSAKQGHRGGVAILMKPSISKYMRNLNKSYENVISFELTIFPNILFVGCYISPEDSPYYDAAVFGHLQSLVKNDKSKKVIIMGDLNSRIGVPTNIFTEREKCVYEGVEDTTVNKNGKCVLQLCEDNGLVILNNLKIGTKHFKSNLSFRKKANWISEPDIAIVSDSSLQHIDSFNMTQRYNGKLLYSDHALMDITIDAENIGVSVELLNMRANNLGRSVHECVPIRLEKSLRLSQCNEENLKQYFLNNLPPTINDDGNVDILLNRFTRIVTDAMREHKEITIVEPCEWGNAARWKRLLAGNDYKKIWKSIGWNGDIEETNKDIPTDEEFKIHFEQLLNPPGEEVDDLCDTTDSPYIPTLDDPIQEIEVIKAAKSSKESKSFIGITPAIFHCFPAAWILFKHKF